MTPLSLWGCIEVINSNFIHKFKYIKSIKTCFIWRDKICSSTTYHLRFFEHEKKDDPLITTPYDVVDVVSEEGASIMSNLEQVIVNARG